MEHENTEGENSQQQNEQQDAERQQAGDNAGGSSNTVSREEYDSLKGRMTMADRNAQKYMSEAQQYKQQLEDIENAKKDDLTKAQEAATAAEQRAASLEQKYRDALVHNAFLGDSNGVQWHSAADAFRLIDLSGVQVDDNGQVIGMKEAVDQLAKDKPFLVKPAQTAPPGVGDTPGGNSRKGENTDDVETLRRRFPALNR